jgi:hypothetical protein
MPIEIREIVTEVVVRGPDEPPATSAAAPAPDVQTADAQREQIVRQAVERVLDILRREWEV